MKIQFQQNYYLTTHWIHYPKPKVISLTQSTEVGTLYSVAELRGMQAIAQQYGLKVHMDGARFSNAIAALNCRPAEVTWRAGVDVLCFGGTKNGMALSEAVIFFDKELAADFDYRCKQAGQLASKMRFIAAPWMGLLETEAWLTNARHANECAAYFAQQVQQIEGVALMFPPQANAVFVQLSPKVVEYLRSQGWQFYSFIGLGGARFMFSWNSTPARIDELVADIATAQSSQHRVID